MECTFILQNKTKNTANEVRLISRFTNGIRKLCQENNNLKQAKIFYRREKKKCFFRPFLQCTADSFNDTVQVPESTPGLSHLSVIRSEGFPREPEPGLDFPSPHREGEGKRPAVTPVKTSGLCYFNPRGRKEEQIKQNHNDSPAQPRGCSLCVF